MTAIDTNRQLRAVTNKIVRQFKPEKIILFGSYAWGVPTADSDVDLFIIADTNETRVLSRRIDISLFPRPFPMDIVVYSPAQVERRLNIGDFFIQEVLTRGKVLYGR